MKIDDADKQMSDVFNAALAITEAIVDGMESDEEQALKIWRDLAIEWSVTLRVPSASMVNTDCDGFKAEFARRLRAEWSKAQEPAAEVVTVLTGRDAKKELKILLCYGKKMPPEGTKFYLAPVTQEPEAWPNGKKRCLCLQGRCKGAWNLGDDWHCARVADEKAAAPVTNEAQVAKEVSAEGTKMKLPKELRYLLSPDDWPGVADREDVAVNRIAEAIVRDCAKVAAGSHKATMDTSFAISNTILARYSLEGKP